MWTNWSIAKELIIGGLKDIVESTLITDLADPCKLKDTKWIKPGTVAWVYWAYNHGSNDYNIIKKYTDMAIKMKLPYVLIDAEWDQMKDGKTIEDAVKYAVDKGIKPINWIWGMDVNETNDIVKSGILNFPSMMSSFTGNGYSPMYAYRAINSKLFDQIPATDVRKGWWLDENMDSKIVDTTLIEKAGGNVYVFTSASHTDDN